MIEARLIAAHDRLRIALDSELLEPLAQRGAEIVGERQGTTTPNRSPYMSVPEAAAFLRCEPRRIYDLQSAGKLSRIKEGARTLALRSEV